MHILLLLSQVLAASQFHYTEQGVAGNSSVFRQTAEISQKKLKEVETALNARSISIQSLEMASNLLENAEIKSSIFPLKKELQKQQLEQQSFFNAVQSDYSNSFLSALKRATKALGYDTIAICQKKRFLGASRCAGDDKSKEIAQKIDRDTRLKAELKEIDGRNWPTLTWSKLDGIGSKDNDNNSTAYLDIVLIANKLIPKRLKQIESDFESSYRQIKREHGKDKTRFLKELSEEKKKYERRLAAEGQFIGSLVKDLTTGKKGCFFGLIGARKPLEALNNSYFCAFGQLDKENGPKAFCQGKNKTQFALKSLQESNHHLQQIQARNQSSIK